MCNSDVVDSVRSIQSASEFRAAAFLHVGPVDVVSVVFDDALVDALQPQSLSIQVARPGHGPAGEEPRPLERRLLAEQAELGVCLYCLGQIGSEGVKGLVDLCVDLDGRCALSCGENPTTLNGFMSPHKSHFISGFDSTILKISNTKSTKMTFLSIQL